MLSFEEMLKRAKEFYDTIDFEPYLKKYNNCEYCIPINELWKDLVKYYDEEHPELLPEDFRGYFFNFVTIVDINKVIEFLQTGEA